MKAVVNVVPVNPEDLTEKFKMKFAEFGKRKEVD